jgi:hypothetical protein
MSLRTALLSPDGAVHPGGAIDDRVCDCCPTDAVSNARGEVVVVYRDRSPEEVRDIWLTRFSRQGWSRPVPVHRDGWIIAGCPVNGPAIAGAGDLMLVAWFTGVDEHGEVRAALSTNGSRSFQAPVRVDGGNPLGRVDVVALSGGGFLVSWMEQVEAGAEIRARRVGADGTMNRGQTVAAVSGERSTGFPKLAGLGEDLFLAWTDPAESGGIRMVRLRAD